MPVYFLACTEYGYRSSCDPKISFRTLSDIHTGRIYLHCNHANSNTLNTKRAEASTQKVPTTRSQPSPNISLVSASEICTEDYLVYFMQFPIVEQAIFSLVEISNGEPRAPNRDLGKDLRLTFPSQCLSPSLGFNMYSANPHWVIPPHSHIIFTWPLHGHLVIPRIATSSKVPRHHGHGLAGQVTWCDCPIPDAFFGIKAHLITQGTSKCVMLAVEHSAQ